jgi:uncharacterized repeat protein (TIGR03803 family)
MSIGKSLSRRMKHRRDVDPDPLTVFHAEALERRLLFSSTPTTVYSFTGYADGGTPSGITIDSNGNLYGTSQGGGSDSVGTVWKMAKGSTTPTTLYSFTDGTDGDSPYGITIDSNGNLYGTCPFSGADGDGTVWELAKGSSTVTTLYSFTGGTDGATPYGITVDSNGNLYGAAQVDGADDGFGTVWELAKGSSTVTTLYTFTNGTDGASPWAITIDSSGNLYGTTVSGGNGSGTVWELPKGSSTITTLYSFTGGADGEDPLGITIDSVGNLYGTTDLGGTNGDGTVWELQKGSSTVAVLYTLTNTDVPAGITFGSNGILYGVTQEGGTDSSGSVFELTTPLTLTTPATAASVNEGSSYAINWTGGNSTDTVQLWAEGGPNNSWTELTTGVPETNGSYTWNTTGVDHGWYYFQAWDIPTSGTSYAVQSPDWLHVVAPAASAPNISLTNPPLATASVAQGNTYTLDFTATDGSGDTNPIYVQLWVYSGNTGQWTELPNANYLPASPGSYVLNTTGMAPGWYAFAAHATNGDQWSYASSPGWLNITVPTPTITFTTPTSGQSVATGGTFNLNWNITGLSSADASNATVQIWAQYLANGSPVWSEIAASVSASGGTYAWTVPTSPGAGTYYAFSIWLNDGDMWWAQASPNWLQAT